VQHDERTRQLAVDALARIDEAIALDGSFGPLHVTKGRFLRQLGRFPESMVAIEEGIKLAPDFHGGYLERGWLRLDDYRRQRPLPTVMITSHGSRRLPVSAEPQALATLLARAMDDLNAGVKLADQSGDGKPRSEGDLLLARAHAALCAGRPDEARELLVDLRRRGSNPEDAAETLGHAHYQSGAFSRAIESFTEAIALRPRLSRLYVARAGARWAVIEMAADRGDDPRMEADAAIEDLDEATRIDGDEPHALVLRALVRHSQLTAAVRGGRSVRPDDVRAVIALYDRAIDMRPSFAAALSGRALVRGMLADRELESGGDAEVAYAGALEDATAAVKAEPECVPAHINRGGLHEAIAEVRILRGVDPCEALRAAADDYATALKLAPGDPVALLGQATARADLAVHSKVAAADAAEQLRTAVRELDRLIETSRTADALVARGNARRVLAQRFMPSGPSAVAEARLAVADYEEALSLRPREWRVVASLALARVALVSNLAPDSEERPEQLRRAAKELSAFGDLAVLKPIRGVVTRAMAQ
jgi:tetratricopeptide (TPR) repeat protein